MKLILLSGGSGTRLWPLSNNARSKQFLKVLKNEDGTMESMVQRVWRQLDGTGFTKDTYIATSRSQSEIMQNQLGQHIKIIIEPERRDTFPAISLACSYLFDVEKVEPDETICILPVDPFVNVEYFHKIRQVGQVLEKQSAEIGLLGVKPTYPSEKYGYIITENQQDDYSGCRVKKFIEKPSESVARELIADGALWNCGVFAFKLKFILDYLRGNGLPLDYKWMHSNYDQLPKISFDYEVVEKNKNVYVLPYEGSWKDLGTWNTITEEISEAVIGKGVLSSDCLNTHVINELDIPVLVVGLSNAVIAVSPDGILVSDKISSPSIKNMVASSDRMPMYEERLWGWHRILDYTKNELGQIVVTKRVGITAGKNLSYQVHHNRTEIWTIISGSGKYVLDGVVNATAAGDVIEIKPGMRHAIRAEQDIELIEVQIGDELIEEDIQRDAINWEDIPGLYQIKEEI